MGCGFWPCCLSTAETQLSGEAGCEADNEDNGAVKLRKNLKEALREVCAYRYLTHNVTCSMAAAGKEQLDVSASKLPCSVSKRL